MKSLKAIGTSALLFLGACSEEISPIHPDSVVVGISYIGITVSDVEKSAAFYQNATDLKEVSRATLNGFADQQGPVETRLLRTSNGQIRLMEFSDPAPAATQMGAVPVNGPGIAHVCFQADQTTQMYQRFQAEGGRIIGAPEMVKLSPFNPVHYAYVHDLDGAIIEVEHVDIEALDLDTPPKNKYRLRHVAFASPDVEQLAEFYAAFLDQPSPRRVGGSSGFSGEKVDKISGLEGSTIKMAWFQTRNIEIEISQYVSHPTELPERPRPLDAPGHNLIVFDVTDLRLARQKFIDAGGTIVSEVEEMDGGNILFGRDTDKNLIGLQAMPKDAVVSAHHFPDNGI